ncbi:MAG: DUF4339 domain-containing protein, partial [Planctomycetes bacterium]|nr:DUF4339 domain-containing protein [Planctomycetota bacterium]
MRTWYAVIESKQAGPFSEDELAREYVFGVVDNDTLVWNDSLPDWTPIWQSGLAFLNNLPARHKLPALPEVIPSGIVYHPNPIAFAAPVIALFGFALFFVPMIGAFFAGLGNLFSILGLRRVAQMEEEALHYGFELHSRTGFRMSVLGV